MGFLDKLKGKKEALEPGVIYAPVAGKVKTLKEIADGVFSEGILGPGCGIEPEGEVVYAPFRGKVIHISDTKHAVGLKNEDGVEVMIHVGLDTVDMNGKGFEVKVKEGQSVEMGKPLLIFNKRLIKEAGHPDIVVVVVLNAETPENVSLLAEGNIEQQAKLLQV